MNAGSFSSKGQKQVAGAFRWRYETVSSDSQKSSGLRRPLAEGRNIGPFYAELAPTVELLTCNEKVGSSNLSFGTINNFKNFENSIDKIEKIIYNIIVKDKIILIFNKHNIFPLRAVSFLP